MGNLVGHHAGQFRFRLRGQEQPGVDKAETAGQRKGIDVIGINDLNRERDLGIGIANQVLTDAVDKLAHDRVHHDPGLLFYLLGQRFPEGNLLLQ